MDSTPLLVRLAIGPPHEEILEHAARVLPLEPVFRLGLEAILLHRFAPVLPSLSPKATHWMDGVRTRVHGNGIALLKAESHAAPLLEGLRDVGIPFCLLKGAALEARKRHLPGRPRVDLDLLVPAGLLEEAERWLHSEGYRLQEGFQSRDAYLREHFHLPFTGPAGSVEVHWSLSRSTPAGAMDRMWRRTIRACYAGMEVQVLSPADHLIHSCVHIAEHAFQGMLRWLAELSLELQYEGDPAPRLDPRLDPRPDPRPVTESFRAEAVHWPPRVVGSPLWLLAAWGDPGAAGWTEVQLPRADRGPFLRTFTTLAMGTRLRGLPVDTGRRSVARWLESHQTLRTVFLRVGIQEVAARLGRLLPDPRRI